MVWQLAESNDLPEAREYEQWLLAGRPPFLASRRKGRISRIEAWRRRSPSCRVLAALQRPELSNWDFGGTFVDAAGQAYPVRFLSAPGDDQTVSGHPGWPSFTRAVREGAALCSERGIGLVVLLVPMKFRVMRARTEFNAWTREQLAIYEEVPDPDTIAYHLSALCASNGVRFVDAAPALAERAGAGELVYLPFDTHLSPRGHEVVADVVAQALAGEPRHHP